MQVGQICCVKKFATFDFSAVILVICRLDPWAMQVRAYIPIFLFLCIYAKVNLSMQNITDNLPKKHDL